MTAAASYREWNDAILEVVFSTDHADRPVYLELDEHARSALAARMNLAVDQVPLALTGAVASRLIWGPGKGGVFGTFVADARVWRSNLGDQADSPPGPPVVALLAVLTLAAAAMEADEEHRATAYYPRLHQLLDVNDLGRQERLAEDYRECAEYLWRSLNEWLTKCDGHRGLPTAYALTHRYVGLPMSQALVRAADRQRFTRMFRQLGLPPGADVPPENLVPLINHWVSQTPCPAGRHLEAMWRSSSVRERIAGVAAIELLHWDGAVRDSDPVEGSAAGAVLLQAIVRRFPKPGLELSFLADLGHVPPGSVEVLSADGCPVLDVVPVAGARVRPRSAADIDMRSLAEGLLHLRDPASGLEAVRRPRRLVPLRRDELLNVYVECERVQLGEDVMLLVKREPKLLADVTSLLSQIGRPGFKVHEEFQGLPTGWAVFTDVQVMSGPSGDPGNDLNALVPLVTSQISLAGGLKLPGRVRKWSSLRPPEIRAAVQEAARLEIHLVPLDEHPVGDRELRWTSDDPALIVDLGSAQLPDGDYEITLITDERAVQQTILRLRSAMSPDVASWSAAPLLVHDPRDPKSVLTATAALDDSDSIIEGPYSPLGVHRDPFPVSAGDEIWWAGPKPSPVGLTTAPVTVARPDSTSCVTTGAHFMQLPTFHGRATTPFITGTCATCGVIKRYPAWWSRKREREFQKRSRHVIAPIFDARHLPTVGASAPGWQDALDSLLHVGGGPYGWLERIALQVEGSRLFVDVFARSLEALGHIEIERDSSMEPIRWRVAPAYLAQLSNASFLFTGAWTDSAVDQVAEDAEAVGGHVVTYDGGEGPDAWVLEGVDDTTANSLVSGLGIGVVSEAGPAGKAMLASLPTLGKLAAALPRIPMPGAHRIMRFDAPSSSWVGVASAAMPGAYRLESTFTSLDVFRDDDDVAAGVATLGSVQLVKHLEARRLGRPLVAYDKGSEHLLVPLGADLPGLYGRAAVLCGGLAPVRLPRQRALAYLEVPPAFADQMVGLLVS